MTDPRERTRDTGYLLMGLITADKVEVTMVDRTWELTPEDRQGLAENRCQFMFLRQ